MSLKKRSNTIFTSLFYTAGAVVLGLAGTASTSLAGEPELFVDGWVFARDEQAGAELPDFSDATWKPVDLPHDWAIAGPFDPQYRAMVGGLPIYGVGWYRKHFTVPASDEGKVIRIRFDGAMAESSVWVNGQLVGERPNGYVVVEYDVSKLLNYGGDNVIAVKLAPQVDSARWYTGAGINRDVWIEVDEPVHFDRRETVLTMPEVSDASATVSIDTAVRMPQGTKKNVPLMLRLLDADGKPVASARVGVATPDDQGLAKVAQQLTIPRPHLWSPDQPYLYKLEFTLGSGKKPADTMSLPVGLRSIVFTPNDGMLINGQRVSIRGVCIHDDNGALGAVDNHRALQRKLQLFKELGVNAIRTSHNSPSPVLVQLANEMGFLLNVESFDVWRQAKNDMPNAYNLHFDEWHERDLVDMIKTFRNDPSVMMWSTGNEVVEQKSPDGEDIGKMLNEIVHRTDPTRPTSFGINFYEDSEKNGLFKGVDIVGLNYKSGYYGRFKHDYPDQMVMGSETASMYSSRGVYHLPFEGYERHPEMTVSSYDIISAIWGELPDYGWAKMAENPAVLGEFVWTGIDYLGEPSPYFGEDVNEGGKWNSDWPARSSTFGMIDLAGFPKDRYYLYQSQWTEKPMVHLLPDWNWPGKEGQPIPVMVYTNGDSAELFLNGKSLGTKVMGKDKVTLPVTNRWAPIDEFDTPYRLRWDVPYEPGTLKVVAYRDGKPVVEKQVVTSGVPAKVEMTPDRATIAADGRDLSYVTITITDADGNIVPYAENLVRFSITGPGEIAGVDNGDATSLDPFQANFRRAYHGKALVILRSTGEPGSFTLNAVSERLDSAEVTIEAK